MCIRDRYTIERGGWRTDKARKKVYQHTLPDEGEPLATLRILILKSRRNMKNKKTFKSRVLLGEIDGMDICARDIKDRKPLTQFAVLGAATCRWWR